MKRNRKSKIVLFGLFGQKNWGNEGTLKAVLANLNLYNQGGEIETICVCTNPTETAKQYGITAHPIQCQTINFLQGRDGFFTKIFRKIFLRLPAEIWHWLKAISLLSGCRALIAPGTGLLNDYASSAMGRPYDILMWSLLSKLCRCKLFFVSVGAGPVKSKFSGYFIKLSMTLADYRSFRDEYSRNFIGELGFDSRGDPVYPDLAFSLPVELFNLKSSPKTYHGIIGVGLKDYYGEEGLRNQGKRAYSDYLKKIAEFVIWLFDNGYKVRLVVGDSLYDEPVKNDLVDVLLSLGVKEDQEKLLFDPVATPEEVITQLSTTDSIISPRFHNIIYGIMLGKPVISLSYHQKFAPLMNDLAISEYCQDLSTLDTKLLIRQFRDLMDRGEMLMSGISKNLKDYRKALDEQYTHIFKQMK